jgi:predicted transposase YbfD/YdcC
MQQSFLSLIQEVSDPRIAGMVTYPADEILFCVFVGLMCGGDDFDDFESICEELLDWLGSFLPFANGIAPAQTMRRVLRAIDPVELEALYSAWVAPLRERAREIVALDGKTLRGSKRKASGSGALHLIQAFACERGVVIGQHPAEDKTNESKTLPAFLGLLALEGATVTADAAATYPEVAEAIVARRADYVLALKANQKALLPDVADYFADPVLAQACPVHSHTSAGHGRIETRTCKVSNDTLWLAQAHPQWPQLKSIAAITAMREDKKTGDSASETRYYISSLDIGPERFVEIVRRRWEIENRLHWPLDVEFSEDHCRIRTGHAARNLALIRRAVLNVLRQDKTKASFKRKRIKAMMNAKYRTDLLAH